MAKTTFLVTGGMGCIGAWTLYHLIQQDFNAICFDLSQNTQRLDKLLSKQEQQAITFVQGDLANSEQVLETFREHNITHVIHLGALQVPFCKANPIAGAQVNVVGTVNIFEAARNVGIKHIAYASSIAVYGPPDLYPSGLIQHNAQFNPYTLYGVYKVANEGTARVYWQDCEISSTSLRPYTVYGVGRDQGLTSEPTKAMLAAAKGVSYQIPFSGKMQFQLASDVALQFIDASQQPQNGALGFSLGGRVTEVAEVASLIKQYRPNINITVVNTELPFPDGFDDRELRTHTTKIYETPLDEGIGQTIKHFESLM